MKKPDYYTVLELNRNCTPQEIRKNFHRLALRWHPDKCLDKFEAEIKFTEIHEAYSVLTDARKKEIYDEFGHEGLRFEEGVEESANFGQGKFFFQKGFQGTEKSAFDILKDIVEENDDDYFFENYDNFGISDQFKTTVKSFIDENIFGSQNEPEHNFVENYRPTFMNPNFFMTPPEFPNLQFDCTPSFFSFFSETNIENNNNTYSKTTTTIFQSGNLTTFSEEKHQNKQTSTEKEEMNLSSKNLSASFSENIFDDLFMNKKNSSILIIDDEATNDSNFSNSQEAELFNFDEFDKEYASENETRGKISSPSKKISKNKDFLNIRMANKKSSKKNRS